MDLINLIRQQNVYYIRFIDNQEYNPNWTDVELLSNIWRLHCWGNQLTSLPIMPNLQELHCWGNQLTSLPIMPNLQKLRCRNNQLNSLPLMPKLQFLNCQNNPLPYNDINGYKKMCLEIYKTHLNKTLIPELTSIVLKYIM